jgi:hypothetical protein
MESEVRPSLIRPASASAALWARLGVEPHTITAFATWSPLVSMRQQTLRNAKSNVVLAKRRNAAADEAGKAGRVIRVRMWGRA